MPDDPELGDSADHGLPPVRTLPVWILPLLIGVVSITAGAFTWRAGQLGSSAAFEDRQSVGQTILQQEQFVSARLGTATQARAYVSYRADFAEAAALDSIAVDAGAAGQDPQHIHSQADRLRTAASDRAVAEGVFTEQERLAQLATSPQDPLSFDVERRVAQLEAEASIGLGSPGVLTPDVWAAQADDTRHRVRQLRLATLALVAVVVVLTAAQLSDRRIARRMAAAAGSVAFVAVAAVTIAGPY